VDATGLIFTMRSVTALAFIALVALGGAAAQAVQEQTPAASPNADDLRARIEELEAEQAKAGMVFTRPVVVFLALSQFLKESGATPDAEVFKAALPVSDALLEACMPAAATMCEAKPEAASAGGDASALSGKQTPFEQFGKIKWLKACLESQWDKAPATCHEAVFATKSFVRDNGDELKKMLEDHQPKGMMGGRMDKLREACHADAQKLCPVELATLQAMAMAGPPMPPPPPAPPADGPPETDAPMPPPPPPAPMDGEGEGEDAGEAAPEPPMGEDGGRRLRHRGKHGKHGKHGKRGGKHGKGRSGRSGHRGHHDSDRAAVDAKVDKADLKATKKAMAAVAFAMVENKGDRRRLHAGWRHHGESDSRSSSSGSSSSSSRRGRSSRSGSSSSSGSSSGRRHHRGGHFPGGPFPGPGGFPGGPMDPMGPGGMPMGRHHPGMAPEEVKALAGCMVEHVEELSQPCSDAMGQFKAAMKLHGMEGGFEEEDDEEGSHHGRHHGWHHGHHKKHPLIALGVLLCLGCCVARCVRRRCKRKRCCEGAAPARRTVMRNGYAVVETSEPSDAPTPPPVSAGPGVVVGTVVASAPAHPVVAGTAVPTAYPPVPQA